MVGVLAGVSSSKFSSKSDSSASTSTLKTLFFIFFPTLVHCINLEMHISFNSTSFVRMLGLEHDGVRTVNRKLHNLGLIDSQEYHHVDCSHILVDFL